MDNITIRLPRFGPDISPVSFMETTDQHDPIPNVRLYCRQWPDTYCLQIRSTEPVDGGGKRPRHLIASAMLTIDQLREIAEYYNNIVKV